MAPWQAMTATWTWWILTASALLTSPQIRSVSHLPAVRALWVYETLVCFWWCWCLLWVTSDRDSGIACFSGELCVPFFLGYVICYDAWRKTPFHFQESWVMIKVSYPHLFHFYLWYQMNTLCCWVCCFCRPCCLWSDSAWQHQPSLSSFYFSDSGSNSNPWKVWNNYEEY